MSITPTPIQLACWQAIGRIYVPRASNAICWRAYVGAGGQARYIGKR